MTLPTFNAGSRVRASDLNALVTGINTNTTAITAARKPPFCQVTRSTAQTGIVTATPTEVVFDTEVFDNDTMFSGPSGTITIKTAGQYYVSAYVGIESNSTGYRRLFLYKNGSSLIIDERNAVTGDATHMTISGPYNFAVNDTLQLYVEQSSGANRSTVGTPRLAVAYQSAA